MDNVMISVEIMKVGYAMTIPLIFLFIITLFVKNQVVKCVLYCMKALAYFGLAFFMWKYYSGKEQMDIVSAFTFIFCCFESADNLISLLLVPIEYIRKMREEEFDYQMKSYK